LNARRARGEEKDLTFGAERGILSSGGMGGNVGKRDESGEIEGFAGAKGRASDIARIEKNSGSPKVVNVAKVFEANVTYVEDTTAGAREYRLIEDVIAFNPDLAPDTAEGRAAIRWHEVMHRADWLQYHSWGDDIFIGAIDKAKLRVSRAKGENPVVFDNVLEETRIKWQNGEMANEELDAIHDILSALREGDNEGLLWYHDKTYWLEAEWHIPMEIFAELGTLDLMGTVGLKVIEKYFPEIFMAYKEKVK